MTAHLVADENVVHTTEQSSGKVHTNSGHPIVGTLQEVVGTLAAIEAGDTAAIAGLVGLIGTLAATEGADAAAITGLVGRAGTLAATEGADTAAFAGLVAITGALAATEAADVASFAGTVATLGTLAATEEADAFAATGIVAAAGEIVGTLTATEGADTAAFAGVVSVQVAIVVGGGGYYPPERPMPVEGAGYGILPRIEGEAHGVVVRVLAAIRPARIEHWVSAGIAGHGAVRLSIKAVAAGDHGRVGAAIAVLRVDAAGSGVAGARGRGSGMVANLRADAVGRHDDDEAAAIAWMLAA
jgi:hypothetical protein